MVTLWFFYISSFGEFLAEEKCLTEEIYLAVTFSKIRLDVMYSNIRIPLRSIMRLGKRTINYHLLCFSYLTLISCLSKVIEHWRGEAIDPLE